MGLARWAVNVALLLLVVGAGAALADSGTRSTEFCSEGWPDYPRKEPCEGNGTPGEMLSVTESVTLTGDHRGAITIDSDGVTLDCAGHSVIGYGPAGIDIIDRVGVTVENCSVWGFDVGIRVQGTTDATITGNTASANQIGFSLLRSSGNLVENNEAHLNRTAFSLRTSDSNRLVDNLTIRGLAGFDVTSGEGNELRANETRDTDMGIVVAGSGNFVAENVLTQANIEVPGSANTISRNEVSGAIRVKGSPNALKGNHVHQHPVLA